MTSGLSVTSMSVACVCTVVEVVLRHGHCQTNVDKSKVTALEMGTCNLRPPLLYIYEVAGRCRMMGARMRDENVGAKSTLWHTGLYGEQCRQPVAAQKRHLCEQPLQTRHRVGGALLEETQPALQLEPFVHAPHEVAEHDGCCIHLRERRSIVLCVCRRERAYQRKTPLTLR